MAHLYLLDALLRWLIADQGPGMDPDGAEGEPAGEAGEGGDEGPMMDPDG